MSLFGKNKKTEPASKYSEIEQTSTIPVPAPVPTIEEQLSIILKNQGTIVANQQTILDYITATQQLLIKLAGPEPMEIEETEEEVLPSEEELEEARKLLAEHEAKKKNIPISGVVIKKKQGGKK